MKRIILAALLIAFALPHSCAQPVDNPESSVSGTVTDSITDQPIPGATVTLRGMGTDAEHSASASTNSDGEFKLEGVSPGRYTVSASHSGYLGQRRLGASLSRQSVTVTPGQRIDGLNIRLAPGATISGRVTDAAGKPLSGVSVQAMRRSYNHSRSEVSNAMSDSTNDDGEYRMVNLPRGEYYLRARYPHPPTLKPESNQAYVPLYYPGAVDLGHSIALTVREGEQLAGIEIHLAPVHTFHLSGHIVSGLTALPAEASRVTLVGDQGKLIFSPTQPTLGAGGTFEFRGVPSGSYILAAELPAATPQGKSLWARVPVQVNDLNLEDVEAVLSPGVEINGRVRVDEKAALDLSQLAVELQPRDESAALTPDAPNSSVNPDGSFLLHDVPEGSYDLNLYPVPSGFYLNTDLLQAGSTVAHGNAPAPPDLILSPALGRIDGTVSNSDESPQPGIPVLLVPGGVRRSLRRLYGRVVTDSSGRFSMHGIAPGDYSLFAGQDLEIADFMSPDPPPLLEQGTAIHVENDSHLNVQLGEVDRR